MESTSPQTSAPFPSKMTNEPHYRCIDCDAIYPKSSLIGNTVKDVTTIRGDEGVSLYRLIVVCPDCGHDAFEEVGTP